MERVGQRRQCHDPMKIASTLLICAVAAICANETDDAPELRSWVLSTSTNAAVRSVAPEVHSVRSDKDFVYVESAGLSLHSFGSLEANQYDAPVGPRQLSFRIPRHPAPATGEHMSTPLGIIGVFVTGVPIYNPIGTASYRDQNIWHVDAVAAAKAGTSQVVGALNANASRHSPIIGFALDGYPIYGPFGWDENGNVHRMKSSYQLRPITRRSALLDGTLLTPGQEGPDVGPGFPLGTFAEDYEFVEGSGDLDEYNGRFTRTPEYPTGTYAYFLTGWPYLIGPRYYGVPRLETAHDPPRAGQPSTLTFTFKDEHGRNIRFLEKVHERQIHLVVVSRDLAEFAHIHPEPAPGDVFTVTHTFAHGGEYIAFADYVAPGAGPAVQRTEIHVPGTPRPMESLCPDTKFTKTVDGLQVTLNLPAKLKAGADLPLSFTLNKNDLQPYLGAWAHIMLVSADGETFIHAHPLENAVAGPDPLVHMHTAAVAGPSPSTIATITGFRKPGLYKLWFQFQRGGSVATAAWVIRVAPPDRVARAAATTDEAVNIQVSSAGFSPARMVIPADQKTRIAFTRADAQNCANEVVFPELGIRSKLPPGKTTVIDLPRSHPGELHFACGMGMFKGALIVR